MKLTLIIGLTFLLSMKSIGQRVCLKDQLVGQWESVQSSNAPVKLSRGYLDTLLQDTTKLKGVILTFSTNGKCSCNIKHGKRQGAYKVDETSCKIIYGKAEKPNRMQVDYILYLDEKYLVLQIPNRHSHSTGFYKRKS